MATTTIAAEIADISGETADADFIVSAQKFVVANVPKNLLKWASTFTNPSSDGGNASGNIVVPIATDSILSVSRNGFEAREVSIDDDSDLRNIVINYACFKEFAKLMMADARQGDFSANSSNMGTEHWIRAEEDSEMLMARIQTIQAQLGERTHFGQMSQQHYNLALAEIKSYIENNTKTLATAMAMQGAR